MSIDYSSYEIKGVNTSPAAPNKRSVRMEVNIELVTVGLILVLDCNMNAYTKKSNRQYQTRIVGSFSAVFGEASSKNHQGVCGIL